MRFYYKVRNDISVSTLTKICESLRSITDNQFAIIVTSLNVNDLRIEFKPPVSERGMENIRKCITEPTQYLKTLRWEE